MPRDTWSNLSPSERASLIDSGRFYANGAPKHPPFGILLHGWTPEGFCRACGLDEQEAERLEAMASAGAAIAKARGEEK